MTYYFISENERYVLDGIFSLNDYYNKKQQLHALLDFVNGHSDNQINVFIVYVHQLLAPV